MEFSNQEVEEIAFITVGLVIISLNAVEITFILRLKHRSTFEKLLLSLALSDLLVGIAVTTFKILDFALGEQKWLMEDSFVAVFTMSSLFSMKNLLAITLDRFLAVKFPIKHRMLATGRRVNFAIILIWAVTCLVGVVLNLVIIIGLNADMQYFILLSAISFISWGLLITFFYGWILKLFFTRQMTTRMTAEDKGFINRMRQVFTGPQKAERAVLFSSILVSVSFIACTYPLAIECLQGRNILGMSFASRILIIMNSMLNSIIYYFSRFLGQRCRNTP